MISFDVTRRNRNPRFRSFSPYRSKIDDDIEKFVTKRDIVKDNKRNQMLFKPRVYSLRRVLFCVFKFLI